MKRFYKAKLGAEEFRMGVTFAALDALCDAGLDPLEIAGHAVREAQALENGAAYDVPIKFDTKTVREILTIGNAHGDEVENLNPMISRAGFFEARTVAQEYLAAFCLPESEEVAPKGKAAPEK